MFGAYRVETLLGTGAAGPVYRARHTPTGRTVALRLLHPPLAEAPGTATRFDELMAAVASLRHPNLAEVFEHGADEGLLFVATPLAFARLRERLAGGALAPQLAASIARQAAAGLAYAHEHGLVHGGVKPENLLLAGDDDDPTVRVVDLGLAALVEAADTGGTAATMGAPAYTAPEQYLGQPASAASDVYALGVVLYEALAGRLPFPAASIAEAAQQHVSAPPPPLRDAQPHIPAELEILVLRCLAKQPAERPGAAELAAALAVPERAPEAAMMTAAEPIPVAAPPGAVAAATAALLADEPASSPPTSEAAGEQSALPGAAAVGAAAAAGAVAGAALASNAPQATEPVKPSVPAAEALTASPSPAEMPTAAELPAAAPSPAELRAAAEMPTTSPSPAEMPTAAELPAVASVQAQDETAQAGAPQHTVMEPIAPAAEPAIAGSSSAVQPPPQRTVLEATPALDATAPTTEHSAPTAVDLPHTSPPQPTDAAATPEQPEARPAWQTPTIIEAAGPPPFPHVPPSAGPRVQAVDIAGRQVALAALTGQGLALGRAASDEYPSVALPDESVAAEHAFVDWNGMQATVTAGTNAPTQLGEDTLSPNTPRLWQSDVPLRIGPYWLRLIAPVFEPVQPAITPTPQAGAFFPTGYGASPLTITPGPTPVAPAAAVAAGTGADMTVGMPAGAAPAATSMGGLTHHQPTPAGSRPVSLPATQEEIPAAGLAVSNRVIITLDKETLTITPGQASTLIMSLQNNALQTDNYRISVAGVPENWVTTPQEVIKLNPNDHQPLSLAINVPRAPESLARVYPVTIYARSVSYPDQAGVAQTQWTVLPFSETDLSLKPQRAKAWRSANYTVTIANRGNTPARYVLSGEDQDSALQYSLPAEPVTLPAGESWRRRVTVSAPIRLVGSDQMSNFTIRALQEKQRTPYTASAFFGHRALLPVWMIGALIAALIGLIAFLMRPPQVTARLDPPVQVLGATAVLRYNVTNARSARLEPGEIALTPGNGVYRFDNADQIPPDLRVVAEAWLITRTERDVVPSVVAPSPTPVPSATIEPTAVPATAAPPAPADTPVPPAVQPETPPQPTAIPTATTPPVASVMVACTTGTRIALSGVGPPRASYLVFFGQRAVSGGSITPNGVFQTTLRVGRERPGKYPVTVRLRLPDSEIPIRTFQIGNQESISLAEAGAPDAPAALMCEVPRANPTPTTAP
jgi:eukaryotic-like serine/threonine-protein kinase